MLRPPWRSCGPLLPPAALTLAVQSPAMHSESFWLGLLIFMTLRVIRSATATCQRHGLYPVLNILPCQIPLLHLKPIFGPSTWHQPCAGD